MINKDKHLIVQFMSLKVMTLFNLQKIEFLKKKYKIIELLLIVQAVLKKWKHLFIEQKLKMISKLRGILILIM